MSAILEKNALVYDESELLRDEELERSEDLISYAMQNQILSGETVISLEDEFRRILESNDIRLQLSGDARVDDYADETIILPVTGGYVSIRNVDDGGSVMDIEHIGSGIKLSNGDKSLELDNFEFNSVESTMRADPLIEGHGNPLSMTGPIPNIFDVENLVAGTEGDALDTRADLVLSEEGCLLLKRALLIDELSPGLLVGQVRLTALGDTT